MADPTDRRETRSPEDVAAETEEPAEATRVRAEDDAQTRARQAEAAASLQEADRTLEDGGERLREIRAELAERERELERTGDLTREVAQHAADLREQTAQILEEARRRGRRGEAGGQPGDASSDSHR